MTPHVEEDDGRLLLFVGGQTEPVALEFVDDSGDRVRVNQQIYPSVRDLVRALTGGAT